MDIEKLKQFIGLIERSSLAEIDLKEGDHRVRLRRSLKVDTDVQPAQSPLAPATPDLSNHRLNPKQWEQ